MRKEHAVVIAGGGPTGLVLAGELALAGVDAAIVERRGSQDLIGSRAGGLHARTIEMLDQRGIAERFLSEGYTAQVAGFAWIPLDISDFPTRHNYGLALRQRHIERILAGWVNELNVPIYRSHEVTGFTQRDAVVDVSLGNGQSLRAQYLVGCDGGRSVVRKTAGIDFAGWDATTASLIAEVHVEQQPPAWGKWHDARGVHALSKLEDGNAVGVLVPDANLERTSEPALSDLREAMTAVYGTDYGAHDPISIARFTDMARQAVVYRERRVLLAGDAAHVHSPVGGQGLNIGVQDAMNLGWKLGRVVNGTSPESLLDTYHAERHPIAAGVLRATLAQTALLRTLDDRIDALRDTVSELLKMEEPRKRIAAMMSGLDVRYDGGDGHPLAGRRMPDLDLAIAGGTVRVFTLLRQARPLLLNFGTPRTLDIAKWPGIKAVDATYDGAWELPLVGTVDAPSAVLIRPDGYVAWAGNGTQTGLTEALTRWFGSP